ncbi:penicillin-binding protein 2 [Desertifilum sp. FACHB-1129]|uniref:peptidoglycan D,D-transpeptidase FtsI family protein n=1 Tax=Desertifilum TaxID=1185872 RepID=UPI0009F2B60F|nr:MULTISPECIES: penicillin-binding protein 2 [Desertifilum]MBD2310516.1 penicillin-binding protein 2 [Desertifilum sp. FACHB-1129]MBD2321968.1 penicillin-binding protein 2 [Desertifilum sp. FACHB-866]MBD2332095.1 penicillin-binding protein 2 [Desertifilum sp. FACHB-868]MDA0209034.1 penicillin-binding protein 2 [Cyanobacteria bacterium FC1]
MAPISLGDRIRQFSLKSLLVTEPSNTRLIWVWGILLVGILGLMGNLYKLQVQQGPVLQQKAREQQQFKARTYAPRRPIVDRNGQILAIDRPAYTLYAHPILFNERPEAIAQALSQPLNKPPAELLKQFRRRESGIQLAYDLSEEVARRIGGLHLDGLELTPYQQRLYPQNNLLAEVVGYINLDRQGQGGVEASYQTFLERSTQEAWVNRAGNGLILPDRLPENFLETDEQQLQLTLDSRLQRVARSVMKQQLEAYRAKRGTVIVMNANNGEILSLVTEPTFDSNVYYKSELELLKNWAVSDLYEPGSTFKPLNIAIALELGAIRPNSVFNDEGQIVVDGWPIQNHDFSTNGGRGALSITDILKYSSNVGMVHIMRQIPSETYYTWLEKLGLGTKSGIDLPGEAASQLKERSQFIYSPVESATSSFGQGFSLTPLQLLQMQAMLANGGFRVTPHVVKGLVDPQGQQHFSPPIPPPEPVFSPQTTQTVLGMMEKVVTDGTGQVAQIPHYRIGGKTGTAQKAHPQGGYYERARITSFVGIVPSDPFLSQNTPRYVVLAVIDEPQGEDAFGSTVAAPIVKSVMEALITLEHIPPSTSQ